MLIRPVPFPDELDEGYAGYVMRLNGLRSMKALDRLMREWAGCTDKSWREVSRLELFSKVANLSVMDFVLHHTTLPLRRGITSYQADLPHGSDRNKKIWWSTAMRDARTGAYFCECCVREDLEFHGRSYWRRSHQVPGLLSCAKHGIPLSFCRDSSAFHQAPSHWIGSCETVDAAWALEVEANETIARYLAICDGLMDCNQPFAVDHVRAVLFHKGASQGLQTSAGKAKAPLLSDKVIEQCGRQWLALVLPDLADKADKVPLSKVDGVFYLKTSASTTFAYVLACASLFESAEEALNALAGPLPTAGKVRVRQSIDIDPDILVSAYINVGGSYAKTAKQLGITLTSAAYRLTCMGLPNMLETAGRSTQKALEAFFDEDCSLQRSAEIGGISQKELKRALTVMASGPMKILSKFDAGRCKGSRRSYPLMPDEVKRRQVTREMPVEEMKNEEETDHQLMD